MGFAEARSGDGSLTGRGHPWGHGLVCGAVTALGGIGHTVPFLIPRFHAAMPVAFLVFLVELAVITWIRHRYMETPINVGCNAGGTGRCLGLWDWSADCSS
jgi:erythrin-vacuolar iron transport family protein